VTVRRATEADLATLYALWDEWTAAESPPPEWVEDARDGTRAGIDEAVRTGSALIGEEDGEVVGGGGGGAARAPRGGGGGGAGGGAAPPAPPRRGGRGGAAPAADSTARGPGRRSLPPEFDGGRTAADKPEVSAPSPPPRSARHGGWS
jgi:hypothetical protein